MSPFDLTFGLTLSHTSTVKMVALLLKADESDDIKAAIITAIINPTRPTGRIFRTSLENKAPVFKLYSHPGQLTEPYMHTRFSN